MKVYQSRYSRLSGSSYIELERNARSIHKAIAGRTKRNPYIRSSYFKQEKIFIKLFWEHLNQKQKSDRKRRLEYYRCAIDLLRNTNFEPELKNNPNHNNELVYRFAGKTQDGEEFYVQVKQNKTGNKHFISVFPWK